MTNNKNHFNKILALDVETSGFSFGENPSKNFQIVSSGLIVSDLNFNPIKELYLECAYNGKAEWSQQAENIHGLSKEYLRKNGLPEEKFAEEIGVFLFENFGIETPITLLGTNVMSFDVFFIKKLLQNYGLDFKFSHRGLDTFSLGLPLLQVFTSDELFDLLGFKKRGKHNSIEDARASLKTFKIIHDIWNKLCK